IAEGEYADRRLWHDFWLSPAALPMSKRDLAKIGVSDLEQLERPLPPGILLRVRVALRTGDDGRQHNQVGRFEAAGIEPPDAFAPAETTAGPCADSPPAREASNGDQGNTDFPFGANSPALPSAPPDGDTTRHRGKRKGKSGELPFDGRTNGPYEGDR